MLKIIAITVGCVLFVGLISGQGQQYVVIATVRCSSTHSLSISGFHIENPDGHWWGDISDLGNITCGPNGRKVLQSTRGIAPDPPYRIDDIGIVYICAPGSYPNFQAFLKASPCPRDGCKAGAGATLPARVSLPCSPEAGTIDITVSTQKSAPTFTEWGPIALGVLLAGSLAWMIRKRAAHWPTRA
jgi:hypothetical protein